MDNQKCSVDAMHTDCHNRYVSWRAVFVGALVGVGLSFLLNLFSIALGLAAFTTTSEGVTVFAVGGFIGLLIGSIIAMFVSGWVAGYLGRPFCVNRDMGFLYGFTTWCVGLVLLVMLSSPVARFISSYASTVTNNTITVVQVGNESQTPSSTMTTTDAEKAANDMGRAGLAIFVLFFFGALSSVLGAHCGMVGCTKKECGTHP